jgi:hypothetical protein
LEVPEFFGAAEQIIFENGVQPQGENRCSEASPSKGDQQFESAFLQR